MTCHQSFSAQTGFDKHRIGRFENRATGQENTRRCLTPDELESDGWTLTARGDWRMPSPGNPWSKGGAA
ncbi:MAG: hypothetical protein R2686_07030 [Candidatus Nanopelagicales bacterium]